MRSVMNLLGLSVLLGALFAERIAGGMGAFVPAGHVTVSAPGQKAIIAYDGFEEVLILATDLRASESVQALRFIPLPSEPRVDLAPKDCFRNLDKLFRQRRINYSRGHRMKEEAVGSGAVELRFHKQLGPHDVTVVHINDAQHFGAWANAFFEEQGLSPRTLTQKEADLIGDYVKRGFRFFVFDHVKLSAETTSVIPLVYRFASPRFYYPLKTSSLFGGQGRIALFVFCDRGEIHRLLEHDHIGKPLAASRRQLWRDSTSFAARVTKAHMDTVALEISELLGRNALLRAFEYQGQLNFSDDLWLELPIHEKDALHVRYE